MKNPRNLLIKSKTTTVGLLCATCLLAIQPAWAADPFAINNAMDYAPGQILVKLKDGPDVAMHAQSLMFELSAQGSRDIGATGISLMMLDEKTDIEETVQQLAGDPRIEYAQPNYIHKATATPNDPRYGDLWGLSNIDAPTAWDVNDSGSYARDCSTVTVAVLDTGINYEHADLAGNMWNSGNPSIPNHGWDFVGSNDNDPMPKGGAYHGNHVAGTIGAVGNNTTGVTGVCWKVEIMSVRVLDHAGSGLTSDIIEGINWAASQGANIINMSLGGSGGSQGDLFNQAINSAGVVTVVAAGNDGTDNDNVQTPFYPCNYNSTNLVCVASIDQDDGRSSFSNYGVTSVDVGAPGSNILSTWPGTSTNSNFASWNKSTAGGSSWNSGSCYGGQDTLYIPANHATCGANPDQDYLDNTDADAWSYNGTLNVLGAGMHYLFYLDTPNSGDYFTTWIGNTNANPIGSGTKIQPNWWGSGYDFLEDSLEDCLPNCSFGFYFVSNSDASTGEGAAVTRFSIQKVETGADTYQYLQGTSMASPHVAGIAAMVMAWNPGYSVQQTIDAILQGGRDLPELNGVTTTGKTVNAMGSLAHLTTPTGVSAQVLP